ATPVLPARPHLRLTSGPLANSVLSTLRLHRIVRVCRGANILGLYANRSRYPARSWLAAAQFRWHRRLSHSGHHGDRTDVARGDPPGWQSGDSSPATRCHSHSDV